MASSIDETKPATGIDQPVKVIRDNFAAAKVEIETLQSEKLDRNGDIMLGVLQFAPITLASLPDPTTNTGGMFFVTDASPASTYFSDGATWISVVDPSTAADIRGLGFFDITNDGSGSGLDADLLDGNHSTAFATAAQGTTADSALQNVVEDTNPQLGGHLNSNSFSIKTDGNVILSFSSGGENAVNWVDIQHETTGLAPIISVKGSDTNIDLKLDTKGTGVIDASTNKIINVVNPTSAQDAATKDYVDSSVAVSAFRLDAGPVTSIILGDGIIVLTSGGAGQAVTLLLAAGAPAGTTFTLKNGLGNSATIITPSGGDTIDGVAGPNGGLLVAPLAFTRLVSDGTSSRFVI